MPRLLPALILFLAVSSTTSAQTVSAIIPMTAGQTAAGGFRDIPPGPQTFSLTIQSNSGTMYLAAMNSGGGQVTWVPQGPLQNVTTATWVTSAPATESQIGTASGYAYMPSNMPPGYTVTTFYTTNAFWTDIYDNSGDYSGGPYYDAAVRLPGTNTSLPSSLPGSAGPGVALPSLSLQASGSGGSIWFTSSDGGAAVYVYDQPSDTWIKADQPYAVTLPLSNYQFGMRATNTFVLGSVAQFTVYYASSDSVNGTAGDTLDILNAFGDIHPNTDL